MPDEYGHLYEQEERLIKAATRGTPPNYRMRGGWECCHNCRNSQTPCCPFKYGKKKYSPYIPDTCYNWNIDYDIYYPENEVRE